MDGLFICAGVVALLVLRLRANLRRRQLDRAYAEALAEAARRAKWSARKALAIAVLVCVVGLWLRTHAF